MEFRYIKLKKTWIGVPIVLFSSMDSGERSGGLEMICFVTIVRGPRIVGLGRNSCTLYSVCTVLMVSFGGPHFLRKL